MVMRQQQRNREVLRSPSWLPSHWLGHARPRCLTSEEITAKLRAAGYSIKTYKVVKEGTVRSLIVDSTGHIAEVAR